MIKTDPGSTKTVVVLIAILIGAVAVTFARINPGKRPSAAGSTPAAAAAKGSGSVTVSPVTSLARNPFRKPGDMSGSPAKTAKGVGIVAQSEQPSPDMKLEPIQISLLPSTTPAKIGEEGASDIVESSDEKPAQPEFVLLATVEGPQGASAVICRGQSAATVVSVGEAIEGGYKVEHIDSSRAVLKNGMEIVVVKRL